MRYKQRIKELKENLETRLVSEGSERGTVEAELKALQTRHKDVEEKLKRAKNELEREQQNSKRAIEPKELLAVQSELEVLQGEIKGLRQTVSSLEAEKTALRDETTTLESRLQDHIEKSAANQTLETSHTAEKGKLEKELSSLRTELKSIREESTTKITALENDLTYSRQRLTSTQTALSELRAAAPVAIPPARPQVEADLRADVAKEIAARKKLERDYFKFVADSDEKQALLKSKLDSARAKVSALKAANAEAAAAATTAPLMTMDDLSHTIKRPRKEAPKTSDFSLTPFFTKHAVVTTDSPLSPSAHVVGEDATVGGDETTIVDRSMRVERNIRIPSAIESTEPTRLLLAGAARKRKAPAKAAPPPPPAGIPEESSGEESLLKPQPKKKRAKKVPEKAPESTRIFASSPEKDDPKPKPARKNSIAQPTSIFDEDPPANKPAPKKRKRPAAAPVRAFREDDGTGRLVVAGDSAEASDVGGLTLRAPVTGVFTKEISPPKKRPEVLKRFFAGGKKIQGREAA